MTYDERYKKLEPPGWAALITLSGDNHLPNGLGPLPNNDKG